MSTLEAALDYLSRGWLVLPLKTNEKVPSGAGWRETDYTVTPDQAGKIWGEGSSLNVGIITGERSGLWVLDVDPDHDGADSLHDLQMEHGDLPQTFTVQTRSGGTHYYFKHEAGLKNSAGRVGRGIDVRAEGGYVVAPPSAVGGLYRVVDDSPVVPAPAWLVGVATKHEPADVRTTNPVGDGDGFSDPYVSAVVARECAAIRDAPDGEQNHTINRAAFALGTLVGAGALDYDEARVVLRGAAMIGGHPLERALPTIESGLSSGMRHPRVAPDPRGGVTVETEGGPANDPQDTPTTSTWGAFDLTDALDSDDPDPEPAIGILPDGKGLFYAEAVNGVAGEPAGGKTFTGMLAMLQEMQAGHCVVLVDLEDTPKRTVRRLLNLGATKALIRDYLVYIRPDMAYSPLGRMEMDRLITDRQPTLVVLDSTGEALALQGSRPNDDDDVAKWFRLLPGHVAMQGPAVVVLDHVAKSSDGSRFPIGSQRKLAAITGAQYMCDTGEPFSREQSGYSVLTVAKDRHGYRAQGETAGVLDVSVSPAGSVFALQAPDGRTKGGEKARLSLRDRLLIQVQANPGASSGTLASLVDGSRAQVSKTLQALVTDNLIENRGTTQNPCWHMKTG